MIGGDETFDLQNQGPEPVRQFDFADDLARVESLVAESECNYAVVVMLTIDHLYWQPPTREDVIDAEFRIHGGWRLAGTVTCSDDVGVGTVAQKRDRPIELCGAYDPSGATTSSRSRRMQEKTPSSGTCWFR